MKSFDSPGDVARAFQFLRKKTWKTASPIDRAMFLSMFQDVPAAYGTHRILTAGEVAAGGNLDWQWFLGPMNVGDVNEAAGLAHRRRYHDGGIKLPENDKLNGWYFVPQYLTLDFFTAARARKAAAITYIQCFMRGTVLDGTQDIMNSPRRTIGVSNGVDKERSHFILDHQTETLNDDRMGTLLRTTLFPFTNPSLGGLAFQGFSNLIATDILRITMEGRWFFSPRFIEEQTTSDD